MPNRPDRSGGSRDPRPKPKPKGKTNKNVKNFFLGGIVGNPDRSSRPKDKKKVNPSTDKPSNFYQQNHKNPDNGGRSSGSSGGSTSANRPGTSIRGNGGGRNGGGRGNGGRGGGGRGGNGGGGGGRGITSNRALMAEARKYVRNQVNQELRGLRQEKRTRQKAYEYQKNEANSLYDRSVGDLNHVFGEAKEQNNLQTQQMLQHLMETQGTTNQQFDQLLASQQGNTQANQDALMGELSRLGIQQGANLGQFAADANFAQNMGQQGRADALSNLNLMGEGASQIGGLINQTVEGSRVSNIGRVTNNRNDMISDSLQQYRGDLDDIFNAMRETRMSRGNRQYEMYKDLEDTNWNRWFQNREANRANRLGWSNFNLSASQANADNMFRQAGLLQEQRQQAALRRAQEAQMQAFTGGMPNWLGQIFG